MKFVIYENKNHNFRLKYPDTWEVLDDNPLYAAAFLSPYEGSSQFRVELMVNVIDLTEKPRSFEELVKEAPGQLKVFLNNFKIWEQKETELGGKKAYQIIYSGKMKFGRQKDLELKHLQVSTLIDNMFYQIGYSHGQVFYEEYLNFITEMIKSFEFI